MLQTIRLKTSVLREDLFSRWTVAAYTMCGCGEREILQIVITITIFSQSIPFTGESSFIGLFGSHFGHQNGLIWSRFGLFWVSHKERPKQDQERPKQDHRDRNKTKRRLI
jgi:hypothetical protein